MECQINFFSAINNAISCQKKTVLEPNTIRLSGDDAAVPTECVLR